MRHNPALPTAKQPREGELRTSFGDVIHPYKLLFALHWPQAMFSAHCDWGKGGAAILLGIIFKSFELLWDETSHRFEFPEFPGRVFKMPTSSENWTYATGRERKEDGKPFVTSVTIIMTEKTFRQTSPCKAKITTKHASYSPVTFVTKRSAVLFFLPSCLCKLIHYHKLLQTFL